MAAIIGTTLEIIGILLLAATLLDLRYRLYRGREIKKTHRIDADEGKPPNTQPPGFCRHWGK